MTSYRTDTEIAESLSPAQADAMRKLYVHRNSGVKVNVGSAQTAKALACRGLAHRGVGANASLSVDGRPVANVIRQWSASTDAEFRALHG